MYRAFLRSVEHQIPRCFDELQDRNDDDSDDEDEFLPATTTSNVAKVFAELYPRIVLKDGLAHDHRTNGHANGTDEHFEDDSEAESEDDAIRPGSRGMSENIGDIREYLWSLADDPRGFIAYSSSPSREWEVPLARLNQILIQHELEETVTHTFGSMGTKVLRVLRDKGRLDEKQISTFGLLRPKDIRPVLTAMQERGYLELQEVPKDNSRQTSKSLWFWYADPNRARQNLLQATYKAMSRCLQRTKMQRAEFTLVVDKADRLDIRGKEDAHLTRSERMTLAKWKEIEERLLVQLGRLDDMVAVLRDFDGQVRVP